MHKFTTMEVTKKNSNARRYNSGKLRYELISSIGLAKVAEVYSKGADKYSLRDEHGNITEDGSSNWKLGLPWMDVIASVQRHIEAWKMGEDNDAELGTTKHLAHAAWGLLALLEFEKTHPELDNRPHTYLKDKRIGVDFDDTLNLFINHWCGHFKYDVPDCWNFDYKMAEKFEELKDNKEFWLSIPPKIDPKFLPFEPACIITARSTPKEYVTEWLERWNFPKIPVHAVGIGQSKVDVAIEEKLDYFIDDKYETFVEMNKAGICTFLITTAHNLKYDIGYRRIKDFQDFKERFL